jgi:hypothetical protein
VTHTTPNQLAPAVRYSTLTAHISQKLTTFEDWNSPYSFFNNVYNARNDNLEITHTFTGSLGTLLGVW